MAGCNLHGSWRKINYRGKMEEVMEIETKRIVQNITEDIKSVNLFQLKYSFRKSKNLESINGNVINKFLSNKLGEKVDFRNWHEINNYEEFIPRGVSILVEESLNYGFSKDDIYI